jgi:hypothetical protein
MSTQEQPPRYLSFLLRFWQVKEKGKWVWRASLESPTTARVQGFIDVESLFSFLNKVLNADSAPEEKI